MTTRRIETPRSILGFLLLILLLSGCGVPQLILRSQSPESVASFRKSPIKMIAVSADERYLMTGQRIESSQKNSGTIPIVQVVDLASGSTSNKHTMEAASNSTMSGVFVNRGEAVITCGKNGLSRMRMKDGLIENILMKERARLISPQGDVVACVSREGVWGVYSTKEQSIICRFPENVEKVLAFSPTEKWVACSVRQNDPGRTDKKRIVFWSFDTEKPESGAGFEIDHYVSENSVFSGNGRSFATVRSSGSVGVWDVNTGRLRNSSEEINGDIQSLAFSPDGTKLAIGTQGKYGKVFLWDIRTGELNELFTERQAEGVTAVCFNHSGETLYLGDSLGNVKQWDIASKRQKR